MAEIIVALDVACPQQAQEIVASMQGRDCWFKIGYQLFAATGPKFVESLARDFPVFLDLKYHDIPHTVSKAIEVVNNLGVRMLTVHALGGSSMLKAAQETASKDLILAAVTVLTSLDEKHIQAIGFSGSINERVSHLARLALDSGLSTVVCSAQEAQAVKNLGLDVVSPGIRLSDEKDDQVRTMTPVQAIQAGVNYLVIGRPIICAKNPDKAFDDIMHHIDS